PGPAPIPGPHGRAQPRPGPDRGALARAHAAHRLKKVGRIPDGGGWRVHGRDSAAHRAAGRAKTAGAKRGYVFLHSAVDGFSRMAYTEHVPDEKGAAAAGFLARAKVWFAAHCITHIHR